MKKITKVPKVSDQEQKRTFAINLIKKKIAKPKVMSLAHISLSSYYRYRALIQKYRGSRAFERKGRSGRITVLSKAQKVSITNSLRANPFQSTRDLADKFHGKAHYSTIYRYLVSAGFEKKYPSSHFQLKPEDLTNRLNFARHYRYFKRMNEIIFSDETSIWLHDNNLPGWFHKNEKNPLSIERHSGKVHLSGGISHNGKVYATVFRSNLNSTLYKDILEKNLLPNAKRLYSHSWWLAIDNSPCHKGVATHYIDHNVPDVLPWPARSPDLNPIENLWALLKRNIRKRFPQTLDQLEDTILEEWIRLPENTVRNLCDDFPRRLKKLYNEQGGKIGS